ncbi:MAG: AraC family transcriptional regulator [Pyrinomonadaceae bacterium]
MDRRIFHIKEKLSQNPELSWTVEKMADTVGLSVPGFKQTFKKKVGVSPLAYLLELRVEKARQLLSDPHNFLQINEIGVICGLTNASHFTRDFKKRNGMTPNEYRDHCAEIEQSKLQNGQE